ncbi:MAG: cytochrome c oxidase subunit II [Actinobacteria bacterium]|nr:cytochrome c oxidase subunit II [Actinomycetota bacterium]
MRRSLAFAVLSALLLIGGALCGTAVAGNGGLAPVDAASPNAEGINESYAWVSIFTGFIFLLVEGSLIWFIVRYRRGRRGRDDDGAQIHGNTNLELAWTVLPVVILVAIGALVFYKLPGIQDVPNANASGGRVDVEVKGYRYYWNFTYPNGVIAVDNLRAPVDQTVKLEISAPPFEVIHSWWIPALGGKFDAIPGVTNESWFRAEGPGVYRGQCAEFCGIQHTAMTAQVEALPRAEFESWLADEARAQEAGTSDLGEETYAGACAKCHGLAGEGDIGPPLAGNSLLQDANALENVIRNGRGLMPPIGKDWEERQLTALTGFLEEGLTDGG